MSADELKHRFREKVNTELERLRINLADADDTACLTFKDYLADGPAQRFYFGEHQSVREFVWNHFPHWVDRSVKEADDLCSHRIELAGHGIVELGPEIDWHRDPITGCRWPRRFWADYNPERDGIGSDPKTICELGRHQHLPRLAKAFLFTGNERYAAEAVAQLESWMEQNPPGRGIHWNSSLEIAIRAISWLWTIFLLLPSRSLSESSARRIGRSLFAQLEHVYRYPSLFSSPNTHLLGEAAALFIAGLVFRGQKRASAWVQMGSSLLAEQANQQVLQDGVHGELSSYYHCYALDFYLQVLVLAQRNGFLLPSQMRGRVHRMIEFLLHLTRPDGTIPLLGDDDGGRALALVNTDYRSFRDALCVGAVMYLREDFKLQAGCFSEEALWLLGPSSWGVFRLLESEPPAKASILCPHAGYAIQRSGWGPADSHVVFDCGGLGILNGGHAHADALSISMFTGGQEFLVDPGTFVYNRAPQWRRYFRSTRAHNTVAIDGTEQAEPGSAFRWQTKLRSRVVRGFARGAVDYLEAEHYGYLRLRDGVIHRRRLVHIPGAYWIVLDDFRGSGQHAFQVHYHFASDVSFSCLQGTKSDSQLELIAVGRQAGLLLSLNTSRPLQAELVCGGTSPIEGWRSTRYGRKTPCPTLRVAFSGPVPAAALTFLAPLVKTGAPGRPPCFETMQLPLKSGNGLACAIRFDRVQDLVIFSATDASVQVGDFKACGEFFWVRLEDGVWKQVLATQARFLTIGEESIFQRDQPGALFLDNTQGVVDETSNVRDLRDCEFQRC